MIRMAAPAIADSLTYIFNQAITLASFPDEWKIARVIPLFKSGHRNMLGNYSPISILPAISKIMERIFYNQLYNYLTEYGLLSSAQSQDLVYSLMTQTSQHLVIPLLILRFATTMRTNSMKNSFMYDGAKLWNSIPKEIRESKSLSCFQNKIATHAF